MSLIRWILGIFAVAAIWAWARMQATGQNGFQTVTNEDANLGSGRITGIAERGSSVRDSVFREQLRDITAAQEARDSWRDELSADEDTAPETCATPGYDCPYSWATQLPAVTALSCVYPYALVRCEVSDVTYQSAQWVSVI